MSREDGAEVLAASTAVCADGHLVSRILGFLVVKDRFPPLGSLGCVSRIWAEVAEGYSWQQINRARNTVTQTEFLEAHLSWFLGYFNILIHLSPEDREEMFRQQFPSFDQTAGVLNGLFTMWMAAHNNADSQDQDTNAGNEATIVTTVVPEQEEDTN